MTHTPASGPFGPVTTPAMSFSAAVIAPGALAPTRFLLAGASDRKAIKRGAATSAAREIELVECHAVPPDGFRVGLSAHIVA